MNNYISLHDSAFNKCEMQVQYLARYLTGENGYKNLGKGIRFIGDCRDYHAIKVHEDDAKEFVERVVKHRKAL